MNPIAVVHLCVAMAMIAFSVPLVRRKIEPNHWYGVRIPEAFNSDSTGVALALTRTTILPSASLNSVGDPEDGISRPNTSPFDSFIRYFLPVIWRI